LPAPRFYKRWRIVAFAVAAIWLLTIHMILLAGSPPLIRRLSVALPAWPAGAPPITIALLSDLHVANPGDTPERLSRTIATVDALRPDLILLAGDFLATDSFGEHEFPPAEAVAPLSGLRAPLGILAVLGNHDHAMIEPLRIALAQMSIPLLIDRAVRRGPVTILGADDKTYGHIDLPEMMAQAKRLGGASIFLAHEPDTIAKLPPEIHLALAGHTHCGQVSPQPIGPIVTSSGFGRRYACGVVIEGDRTSVITAGLGASNLPIRLGASPDLWLITVSGR
jgi:uncharacterized protein